MGNGGAMRSAPVGAYFFDDLDRVVAEARKSAEVTHSHPEGQAGAVAVALAAAYVATGRRHPAELFEAVLGRTPNGETRAGLVRAAELPFGTEVRVAVEALGNGTQVLAQDTVPFSLWCAARHLGDFAEALWTTVAGLGDRDTTCAIVGGILSHLAIYPAGTSIHLRSASPIFATTQSSAPPSSETRQAKSVSWSIARSGWCQTPGW
jgi:ADP-ribosylglycohydrolase